MKTSEVCNDERRRSKVRDESLLNGLDYVEVSTDQHTLTVYFLGKAPERLDPSNIQITGGQRIRNIQVTTVTIYDADEPESDDYMEVNVDRPGDFSDYTLRIVEIAGYRKSGEPIYRRFPGFDNRYAEVTFSFKAGCPSDLDCAQPDSCPPALFERPEINYLAKDYNSFRQLILDRLALIMPGWQERHVPDLGIALVEVLAYVGDYLSYYQDAVANEAYLNTARQRISVRRHTRLIDYPMHEGCNARTWIFVHTSSDVTDSTEIKLLASDIAFITSPSDSIGATMLNNRDLQGFSAGEFEVFEPLLEDATKAKSAHLHFYTAHNEIWFYTWGDQECSLPRGATSATLQDYPNDPAHPDAVEEAYLDEEVDEDEEEEMETDEGSEVKVDEEEESAKAYHNAGSQQRTQRKNVSSAQYDEQDPGQGEQGEVVAEPEEPRILHLRPGDFLLFEEVRGAKTGLAQDALPTRRHVVRLTKVECTRDELYDKNVVEIAWAPEDELPFSLCISSIGRAPDCTLFQNISVARGNLLLADHGQTISPIADQQQIVPVAMTVPHCDGEQEPSDITVSAGPFSPRLSKAPLTFSQPLLRGKPASLLTSQEARQALPAIMLTSVPRSEPGIPNKHNTAQERVWQVQPDLLESGANDYHVVVEIDNTGDAHLRFGDNELGRSPEPGETFHATYRIGNGPSGNIGGESIAQVVFRHDNMPAGLTLIPRNPFPATGGTGPEPLSEVQLLAPKAIRSKLERAITASDYAQLAEQHVGVQRAAASLRWNGSGYDVLVVIDPYGTETLSTSLRDDIALHLEQYRRIGHDVLVAQAEYVPIEMVVCVEVQPHYLRGHVKADLLRRLSNGILPDGTRGFFHPDNLSFGDSIAVSALIATAQLVPGVVSVDIKTLQRFGEGPNQEIQRGVLEIGPLEIAQLDNDANFPEHGTLTLNMKGGR